VSGVDPVAWQACADPAAAAARPYVFAFDVAPDAAAAAVAVAGAGPDGRCVLEVVAHGPGTAWLVPDSLAGIRANYRGARIVADDLTAAAVVADATRRRLRIDTVPAGFVTRACGAFVDAVVAGMIAHRDQPALNAALRVARRRPVGDGWVWSLRTSAGDVTPLRAVTLAAWAWRSAPRRDGRVVALGA
jgi:hypothetical protein